MKKLVSIIFLWVALANFVYCQNYNPLIRENTYWDVNHGNGQYICFLSGGDRYYFDGDTILNSILYGDTIMSSVQYKILKSHPLLGPIGSPYCPPFSVNYNYSSIQAFMREDSLTKQVFIYGYLASNAEALLFDYSLNAGDTLISVGSPFPIDSVSYIQLDNGQFRKIWFVNNGGNNNPYYIEGVVGSQGIINNFTIGLGVWEIPLCVTENNLPIWGNECSKILNINHSKSVSNINLFPNPTSKEILVEIIKEDLNLNYVVEILDLSGKILLRKEEKVGTINLNIENLSNGVYICRIIGENQILNQKFVVQKY